MLLIKIYSFFFILLTVLPIVPSGKWVFRVWDFPRLQLFWLLIMPLVFLVGYGLLYRFDFDLIAWVILLGAAVVWQALHFVPFSPIWPKEVPDSNSSQRVFKVLVSNLDYENPSMEQAKEKLLEIDCDILLLVEVTEQWQNHLGELRNRFDHHFERFRDEGLGMAIWSKLPWTSADAKYLVSDRRVSLWVNLTLANGRNVNFVGVHPTPPGLNDSTGEERRDSRVRDAELVLVANEVVQQRDQAWIVAGDFNDVAWSHTTRLFKRLSGLKDPRVGRGFMGTFIAHYPLLRFPIDHLFVSPSFKLRELQRYCIPGSDHFSLLAEVNLDEVEVGTEPVPEGDDIDEARALVKEGIDDAEERNVASVEAKSLGKA